WDCAIDLLLGTPAYDITIKNQYPLPLITSTFELLQQAKIFTKLDLQNAYHLVQIWELDEWKTGFNTLHGHYEYLVILFGLTNAPAVFQSFINEVLRDFLNDFVYVYLDDILIFSPNPAIHQHHVRQLLLLLLENKLYIKAEKCEFRASSVLFLGYVISDNHIKMDTEKGEGAEAGPDGASPATTGATSHWSQMSLDFITGRPPSKDNITVLMVVNQFSKITHFIPLSKLPTAKETGQSLPEVTEVVRKLLGGKAPGVDEIRPEYLKSLDVVGLSWLTRLCSIAWRSGTVPLEWQTWGGGPSF
ncbi:hypothetical protein L3Q82_014179, partial [Scortum barcoo]